MIDGLSVLAVIPARGGSKGVPGKNLRPVGGRPLIEWTIDAARGSELVDRTILSSDDDQIIRAARAAGCDVPFRRPAALATNSAASIDVLLDSLDRLPDYDVVVLLQPTSPLRTTADIDAALRLLATTGAPSCVSVCAAADHPWLTFADCDVRLTPYCEVPADASLRRQDLPPAWVLNGAVYALRVADLRADRRLVHPGRTAAYVMSIEKSHDIDTWDDIRLVNNILSAG